MLARPRGVRRPRTRGRLAPLALNGNPGVSPKELRPRYPGIVASIRPRCGSVSVQCGRLRRAMARGLTSVEMTSTTGLRVETGQHVFLPGGEEDCHVGPDLLDVGLVDPCVGVSLDFAACRSGPARDGLGDRARRLGASWPGSCSLGAGRRPRRAGGPQGGAQPPRRRRGRRPSSPSSPPGPACVRRRRRGMRGPGRRRAWPGGSRRRPGRPARRPAERTPTHKRVRAPRDGCRCGRPARCSDGRGG